MPETPEKLETSQTDMVADAAICAAKTVQSLMLDDVMPLTEILNETGEVSVSINVSLQRCPTGIVGETKMSFSRRVKSNMTFSVDNPRQEKLNM